MCTLARHIQRSKVKNTKEKTNVLLHKYIIMYIGYELLQRPVTCDETVSFQFKKSLKILQG
jgi:hypothetical protein